MNKDWMRDREWESEEERSRKTWVSYSPWFAPKNCVTFNTYVANVSCTLAYSTHTYLDAYGTHLDSNLSGNIKLKSIASFLNNIWNTRTPHIVYFVWFMFQRSHRIIFNFSVKLNANFSSLLCLWSQCLNSHPILFHSLSVYLSFFRFFLDYIWLFNVKYLPN